MTVTTTRELELEAAQRDIRVPQDATLTKYGLTRRTWLLRLQAQGWACGVCGTEPSTGRYVTDHEHVRGYKDKPASERAKHVRGITCWFCNRYLLARGISVERAEAVAAYLRAYEQRVG